MSMFTLNLINMRAVTNYPLLHAKAANTRVLVAYLSESLSTLAAADPGDQHLQVQALCTASLAGFLWQMDAYDRYLNEEQAEVRPGGSTGVCDT
jgi:hypothetical protein